MGNNRDYKTRDRLARRNLSVLNTRIAELTAQGVAEPATVASYELRNGELKDQLRAWVDPILTHHRAMQAKHKGN